MKYRNWRDQLSLFALLAIIGLWVFSSFYGLSETIVGATIVVFTLIGQFYFRKSGPSDNGSNGG